VYPPCDVPHMLTWKESPPETLVRQGRTNNISVVTLSLILSDQELYDKLKTTTTEGFGFYTHHNVSVTFCILTYRLFYSVVNKQEVVTNTFKFIRGWETSIFSSFHDTDTFYLLPY
jgi:hypothetical protein